MSPVPSAGGPRVSVCVPVYNGEPFLRDALDSVLAQTFGDYELIISDNASTDATPEICEAHAARDSRIRYYRNAVNIGANPNFNRLVALARAPYFKLANADDLSHPELLARCVSVLDERPDVVLSYGRTRLIDGAGAPLGDYDDHLDLPWTSARARFSVAVERIGLVNVLQGVIRAEALRRTALLASFPEADLVLVAELALHGKFYEVPERLFSRRMHAGAASSIKDRAARQAFIDPAVRHTGLWVPKLYLGYLAAVRRAPLPPLERLALFGWLIRAAVRNRGEIGRELFAVARSSVRRAAKH